MLGVDLEQLPEVPAARRRRHLSEGGARHPPAARRRLRRRAARLQRPVPARPALHRLLRGGAGHQVPAVERGVPAAVRRRLGRRGGPALRRRDDGRDRVGGVERPGRPRARADADRVPPRRVDLRRTRTQPCAEADRPRHRVVYTGLFSPAPDAVELDQAAAGHLVPRQPRVPAAVHRGVGRADHRALRARRDVRHPVDAVGRHRAARRRSSSRPSTSASPATRSRTG